MSLTTIDLDDEVLAEVMRVTGIKTKKEAVNVALRELAARQRRIEALERYAQQSENWDHAAWERGHAAEKSGNAS